MGLGSGKTEFENQVFKNTRKKLNGRQKITGKQKVIFYFDVLDIKINKQKEN